MSIIGCQGGKIIMAAVSVKRPMACYSAQDNENWQKRSEKQLTKIMKNVINIAFCRSV